MIYKSEVTPTEDGVIYSIAIKFSTKELAKSYPYFSNQGSTDIPVTLNLPQFVKSIGGRDGIQSEMAFLRNLVFEAEHGVGHTGKKLLPGIKKKKKRKKRS